MVMVQSRTLARWLQRALWWDDPLPGHRTRRPWPHTGHPDTRRGRSTGQAGAANSHLDAHEAFTAWKILIVVFLVRFLII